MLGKVLKDIPKSENESEILHFPQPCVLFNEQICSASSSISEESSLPLVFSFQWDRNTGNVVGWFFLKPNYFLCQSTIFGKEAISKKGSVYSQSSKQKGTTKVICS